MRQAGRQFTWAMGKQELPVSARTRPRAMCKKGTTRSSKVREPGGRGRTDEPRKRPRRGRNDASRECARGGDRPTTARDRSGAQNMRIKGMGKGARSLAGPLVCSGRTREMERFEKNQVKQNIRPTEQEIERGSNEQNQTSVGFSRP